MQGAPSNQNVHLPGHWVRHDSAYLTPSTRFTWKCITQGVLCRLQARFMHYPKQFIIQENSRLEVKWTPVPRWLCFRPHTHHLLYEIHIFLMCHVAMSPSGAEDIGHFFVPSLWWACAFLQPGALQLSARIATPPTWLSASGWCLDCQVFSAHEANTAA